MKFDDNSLGIGRTPLIKLNRVVNGGGATVRRFKEGIERFLVTDINNPASSAMAQSELAVTWDHISTDPSSIAAFNHVPGGCNVLYMDGHVQFQKYPGEFPCGKIWATFMTTVFRLGFKTP